jgi:hypothetical protein
VQSRVRTRPSRRAGEWRGLEVAIKTILFESGAEDLQTARVASEAAIACNLDHHNVVATYSHNITSVAAPSSANMLDVFKFFLIQARALGAAARLAGSSMLSCQLTAAHPSLSRMC